MAKKEQPTANRNYKDTVFRMLFSDRKNLLSLYNAVSGSHYDDPEKLEIITLENAIYMGMKNDLAFIIGTDLFLYEHQSTYSPNMPLRDLFYISSEYQKLVDHKSLYSSCLLKVPAPQFIVFYNGTEKKKDHWVNHLSEAFENLSGEPKLELEVLTLNINEGHNEELMEQCQTLREYAQYVENYYGTPKAYVQEQLNAKKNVILEIEVQGALQVKKIYPEGVLIFMVPPNLEELGNRLTKRGTEDKETINKRLRRALEEMELVEEYDYLVINDTVEQATEDMLTIVAAEKMKCSRNKNIKKIFKGEM